jgi:hypothetical protein
MLDSANMYFSQFDGVVVCTCDILQHMLKSVKSVATVLCCGMTLRGAGSRGWVGAELWYIFNLELHENSFPSINLSSSF